MIHRRTVQSSNNQLENILRNLMTRQSLTVRDNATAAYLKDYREAETQAETQVAVGAEQLHLDSTATFFSNTFIKENRVSSSN